MYITFFFHKKLSNSTLTYFKKYIFIIITNYEKYIQAQRDDSTLLTVIIVLFLVNHALYTIMKVFKNILKKLSDKYVFLIPSFYIFINGLNSVQQLPSTFY